MDTEVSRKKDLDLGFFGEPRGGEAHFSTKRVYQSDDYDVKKFSVLDGFGKEEPQWQQVVSDWPLIRAQY